ncbi:hypothetical protein HYPSUDRAFT_63939 [Hypholoma sublateritium FD-334 SS-4]|uniref:Uncharacterized protein n=1 Tax=Hypholoma sublateritium (strain FD-334 SS-4) TaxID=945553 RepID=A0A0D2MQF7_HYPSF|nr:hypothetical protein HYPSUDRAFT_63939 [Hypholoma sublateritium FD-334 SS-4]
MSLDFRLRGLTSTEALVAATYKIGHLLRAALRSVTTLESTATSEPSEALASRAHILIANPHSEVIRQRR